MLPYVVVIKTTVYLPEELKRRLAKVAQRRGVAEAELIRESIHRLVRGEPPVRPRFPLFASGDERLAERVDKELARGFGRD